MRPSLYALFLATAFAAVFAWRLQLAWAKAATPPSTLALLGINIAACLAVAAALLYSRQAAGKAD